MKKVVDSFNPSLFSGKCVVVSGATSGIGLALAHGFVALGAQVEATGSSEAKIAAAVSDAQNAGIRFHRLDVRDSAAVTAWMQERAQIDVLINAQGIARPGDEWSEPGFLDVMDVNLNSAFRLTMSALPQLEASGGCVINFASMLSYLADAEVPAYTASKTGILGLTRALGDQVVGGGDEEPCTHRGAGKRQRRGESLSCFSDGRPAMTGKWVRPGGLSLAGIRAIMKI